MSEFLPAFQAFVSEFELWAIGVGKLGLIFMIGICGIIITVALLALGAGFVLMAWDMVSEFFKQDTDK